MRRNLERGGAYGALPHHPALGWCGMPVAYPSPHDLCRVYWSVAAEVGDGAEDGGDRRVIFDIVRNLARLEMREFNREVALERINEALQIANQLDSDILIASGLMGLADIHAASVFSASGQEDHARLARECFVDASALLTKVGNESELAKCLTAFGRFCLEQGDEVEGRAHLNASILVFERLGMKQMTEQSQHLIDSIGQVPESF